MTPEDVDKLIDMAVSGMLTDGGHHKQWYLEEIAKLAAGCPTETVTATDHRGNEYSYERLARGPLEERLAAESVYFDDGEIQRDGGDDGGDNWVIESGVAP